jgi:TRAP transporter TAXI family solute receptor
MRKFIVLCIVLPSLVFTLAGCRKTEDTSPVPDTAKQLPEEVFYTIGTGGVTGVYYPTGGAIARIVNRKRDQCGMRLTVESTPGSVFNINAVVSGDLDFGVVQSDRQYQAMYGLAEWAETGRQSGLRSLFALYPESITLCVSLDSGINSIKDLRGKRINIGDPGSGQRQNSIDALEAYGIDYSTDFQAEGLPAAEAPAMLQDGRIDGFFYTVGHPSAAFKEAASGRRKIKFVPIKMPRSFYKKHPYYTPSVVPVSHYPGVANEADVPTFGVKATFVTAAGLPDDHAYCLVREVFENLEDFKDLHPAYAMLTRKNMLKGISAPLHPGARKYFKETRWTAE